MSKRSYRPLVNPATGETYTFLDAEPGAPVFRMRWQLAPGGSVPTHRHPKASERFEITAGAVQFWLGGERVVRGAGESLTIPAGVAHRFAHAPGAEAADGFVEVRPGLRMREFFEAVSGLSREGRSTAAGVPRNPLQMAAFADGFWPEFRVAQPPPALQRLVLPVAGGIARRLGYRDHYPRYDASSPGP